jgi:HEPN domain-containing protein
LSDINIKMSIDVLKVINHWIITSDEDFQTMLSLYDSGSYNWALFLGHISVEKPLKALYVKKYKEHAPFLHNLFRLADLNEMELSDEKSDWLDKITSFNLNARYDDYKREFYILCTKDFTEEWIKKIGILREWIKQQL